MIRGAGQIFKYMYRNGFIFVDNLSLDDRDSLNFQVTSSKLPYFFFKISVRDNRGMPNFEAASEKATLFLGKIYHVIIGAVRIFKWHH